MEVKLLVQDIAQSGIGKNYALKKYAQFHVNNGCFFWENAKFLVEKFDFTKKNRLQIIKKQNNIFYHKIRHIYFDSIEEL